METLWIIFLLLIATRTCGAIAARLNFPVLIGEIVAGVAIGTLIQIHAKDWEILALNKNHHFMTLSDLGIFFLVLLGEIELRPKELVETRFSSLMVALTAMLVPLAFWLAWVSIPESELRFAQSFFCGDCSSNLFLLLVTHLDSITH